MASSNRPSPAAAPRSPILGSVVCTPSSVQVGDPVVVEVRGPDGTPFNNRETVPIAINGSLGTRHILVWNHPGAKKVIVVAGPAGTVETLTASVQVTPRTDGRRPVRLSARRIADQPSAARFVVEGVDPPGLLGQPTRRARTGQPARQATVPGNKLARIPAIGSGGQASPIFTWDLGDGKPVGSNATEYVHDFTERLDPNRGYQVFSVRVTVRNPSQPPVVVERTVTVYNPYFLSKQRGVLQPPVVSANLNATVILGSYLGAFRVYNPEPYDLMLTSLDVEPAYPNSPEVARLPGHLTIGPTEAASVHPKASPVTSPASFGHLTVQPATASLIRGVIDGVPKSEAVQVILKAKSTTLVRVVVPESRVPKTAIGFAARYRGKSRDGHTIEVKTHFDLPWRMPRSWAVAPAVAQALDALVAQQLVPQPRTVTLNDLRLLDQHGTTLGAAASLVSAALNGNPPPLHLLDHVTPKPAAEGDPCQPDNLPDAIPDGLACMPTAQKQWISVPARFVNALKGDIVIVPADGSLISAVLTSVWPPQWFSHSGIMTRNGDEITHSTAVEARVTDQDHGFVGASGVRPDILKYLWPGVITQSIDSAVNGETKTDPETGANWTVGGFGTLASVESPSGGAPFIQSAMVIKPKDESADVRARLHGIADFAWQQVGKAHYRFFCYTDPTIGSAPLGKQQLAPAEAKWAAGTYPTVCSSFIWLSIQQALEKGEMIEGPLEPEDMAQGAQHDANTPDGLYLYTADERLVAGEVLFERLQELIADMTGGFADFITDVQDDIANQILNSFAIDWSDSDAADSDNWRQTVDANAVSPQNLTFYDAPLYGYQEPLIYRERHNEQVTVYTWHKVAQTGTVSGKVLFQGKPVEKARVWFTENLTAETAADGTFHLASVPVGNLELNAQKVEPTTPAQPDGLYLSAQVSVVVTANHDTQVDIDLQPPPVTRRRAIVDGWIKVIDYEFAAAANPWRSAPISYEVDLSPDAATHVTHNFDQVADNDTLGRLILTIDLNPDNSFTANMTIRCYDSNSDNTDDYDEQSIPPCTIAADGEYLNRWVAVDGENYAEAHLNIRNVLHQS